MTRSSCCVAPRPSGRCSPGSRRTSPRGSRHATGASELEAAAEEEGTDVIRLLTIHAAKGLEFKVVVVADAGRDRGRPDADEILCLPDGRLGFRVADPATGKRLSTSEYEAVRQAEQDAEQAERRRLYYVAMTLEIERDGARLLIRLDRWSPGEEAPEPAPAPEAQLSLFEASDNGKAPLEAPELAPLAEIP